MKETIQISEAPTAPLTGTVNDTALIALTQQLAQQTGEINEFTYIVSHDLQAPLRMVTGFLELLEKRYAAQLDDNAKKYIDFAVRGASKMQQLIADLLVYSRLNTGEKNTEDTDLNLVLLEVQQKLASVITATGASILSDRLPLIVANKKQMTQLLEQLIDNAIKYRTTEAPAIRIHAEKGDGHWKIGIADNGIGIEAAFSEKIFTMFRRLHSDDDKYSGTGAGLAICKKIIALHGGSIWIEPGRIKGTNFFFTIPDNN